MRVTITRPLGSYRPGQDLDLPEGKAAALVSAGIARPADTQPPATTDEPPRSGTGSTRDAWARFAASLGLPIGDDDSRDDIVAAVDNHNGTAHQNAL